MMAGVAKLSECNAPLNAYLIERGVQPTDSGSHTLDAGTAAEIHSVLSAQAKVDQQVANAEFRRVTLQRLRESAAARRAAEAETKAVVEMRVASAAADPLVSTDRAVSKTKAAPSPPPTAQPPRPSTLAYSRASFAEQAQATRSLMLGRLQVLPLETDTESDGDADGAAAAFLSSAPMLVSADQPAEGAASASVVRTVTLRAMSADRALAHEARLRKKQDARKAVQRAALAEAVTSEREAAAHADALRRQVAALAADAIRREQEAVAAADERKASGTAQKTVEAERYIEAYRKQLQNEVLHSPRPLPPLCPSGLDPLDQLYTERCARNCVFFGNPAAYGRALSGLFVRPIVIA